MATIRERNGTYQITVYSGFDLNGRRKRETTTFTPPKELSPKKKEKVVQAFAIDFENRVKNGLVLAGEKTTLREFVDRWRGIRLSESGAGYTGKVQRRNRR